MRHLHSNLFAFNDWTCNLNRGDTSKSTQLHYALYKCWPEMEIRSWEHPRRAVTRITYISSWRSALHCAWWLPRTAASWPVTRIPAAAGERCRKWVAFTFTGQRSKLSSQLTERFCVSLCHSQCFVVWSETSSQCFVRAVVFMFGGAE